MRMPRIKLEDRVCAYHCISRTVGGEFLLDDFCKEHFMQRMWRQADFCGVGAWSRIRKPGSALTAETVANKPSPRSAASGAILRRDSMVSPRS